MRRFNILNLHKLCDQYKWRLNFTIYYNKEICNYIEDELMIDRYNERSWIETFSENRQHMREYIRVCAKLDPVKYHNDKVHNRNTYYKNWFLDAHREHLKFAEKTLPIADKVSKKYDYFLSEYGCEKLNERYGIFLNLCLNNPTKTVIPTLLEDFIWHSHMTDHDNYVKFCKEHFGKIIGHNTDISEEKMKGLKADTLILRDALITSGTTGSAILLSSILPSLSSYQENKEKKENKDSGSVLDDGDDLIGFGPTGIYQPLNPFNNVNPLSPYYHKSSSDLVGIFDSIDSVSSSDSFSSDSFDSSDSSSCGSSCGGDD